MVPKLYILPGLGADSRMFVPLQAEGIELTVVEFIPPLPGESLPGYAQRMAEKIDTSLPYYLAGVSLGGMVAAEMASFLKPEKLLLISTIKHRKELPPYFRLARFLPVHRVFNGKFMRKYAPRERTKDMDPLVRKLLGDMRLDADPKLIEWALDAVLKWKRVLPHPGALHIHGSKDPLFPPRFIRGHKQLNGGGHTMVMTHAKEVATWLRTEMCILPPLTHASGHSAAPSRD
jgi:pimeloyl-ACP methyl ester carboxylesterase